MTSVQRSSLAFRLRKTKAALLAFALTLSGILLIMVNGWLSAMSLGDWNWLHALPLGGTLFGAGLLGTLFEYSFRKDQQEATAKQFRQIIREEAPAMRDAVVDGFAIHPDDLKRVANPELLDQIATNVLSLRLGDDQFAREIYEDIRDQAIHTAERWYDVNVNVRLSTAVERTAAGRPLFDALIEWEYTTTPSHATARFACVSDLDEFHDLIADAPATSTWFMTPRPGLNAARRESFELVAFSVDGKPRKIRRTERKSGQTYTVSIGDDLVRSGKPVRIRHAYRVAIDPSNHRLFLAIAQPARNVSLELDYSATDIARMSVSDLVPSRRRPYVSQLPAGTTGRELTIEVPGWVQAGVGFTFVWTLASEELPAPSADFPEVATPAA